MPDAVDVCCPDCRKSAKFEFAEIVWIKLRGEIQFFQRSQQFEYTFYLAALAVEDGQVLWAFFSRVGSGPAGFRPFCEMGSFKTSLSRFRNVRSLDLPGSEVESIRCKK